MSVFANSSAFSQNTNCAHLFGRREKSVFFLFAEEKTQKRGKKMTALTQYNQFVVSERLQSEEEKRNCFCFFITLTKNTSINANEPVTSVLRLSFQKSTWSDLRLISWSFSSPINRSRRLLSKSILSPSLLGEKRK